MPEIELQRRQGPAIPWWAWLLAALLLIGLIWWAIAAMTPDRVAEAPTEPTTVVTDQDPDAAILPVDQIVLVPANYFNQTVSGTTRVAEVVSDRGFWIEEGGQRAFAVLDKSIPETPPDVNAGQRVFLQGVVQDAANTTDLEADALQALQGQKAYIRVTSIRILDQAAGATPGATPGDTQGQTGQTTGAEGEALPLASVLQNAAGYSGQTITGVATVPQVISDRGFWVESGGSRMLAVLAKDLDSPEVPPDVNAGQTVRLHGTVYGANEANRLADADADTKQAIQGQQAFIQVSRIEILNR